MSDPVTTQPESILDDLLEALDIQEDDNGVTKIREHYTIQVHKIVPASSIPANGKIGVKQAAIPYSVGGVNMVKNPPAGCRFLCVADGVTPLEHPGDMCIRRQTWEAFGKFVTPPAEWNV
jgi:hypothetical protein